MSRSPVARVARLIDHELESRGARSDLVHPAARYRALLDMPEDVRAEVARHADADDTHELWASVLRWYASQALVQIATRALKHEEFEGIGRDVAVFHVALQLRTKQPHPRCQVNEAYQQLTGRSLVGVNYVPQESIVDMLEQQREGIRRLRVWLLVQVPGTKVQTPDGAMVCTALGWERD